MTSISASPPIIPEVNTSPVIIEKTLAPPPEYGEYRHISPPPNYRAYVLLMLFVSVYVL